MVPSLMSTHELVKEFADQVRLWKAVVNDAGVHLE